MRKLIASAFMYSLDGLLADEGTDYWQFCFGLPVDPADLEQKIGAYQSVRAPDTTINLKARHSARLCPATTVAAAQHACLRRAASAAQRGAAPAADAAAPGQAEMQSLSAYSPGNRASRYQRDEDCLLSPERDSPRRNWPPKSRSR